MMYGIRGKPLEPMQGASPSTVTDEKIQLSLEQLEQDLGKIRRMFTTHRGVEQPNDPFFVRRRVTTGYHEGHKVSPETPMEVEEEKQNQQLLLHSTAISVIKLETISPLTVPKTVTVGNKDHLAGSHHSHFSWLSDRPMLRLLVIFVINGLLTIVCAALIVEIELPAQKKRLQYRWEIQHEVVELFSTLTTRIKEAENGKYDAGAALDLLGSYTEAVKNASTTQEEIPWEMLSAQQFILSVQTTTGYGNIIPVTIFGKLFTLMYALIGVPIFMWYIVKLGSIFRLLVMKFYYWAIFFACPYSSGLFAKTSKAMLQPNPVNHHVNNAGEECNSIQSKRQELNKKLKQQFNDDKRFHPVVIGLIAAVVQALISVFISHIEVLEYLNAVYGCFITYSSIGFGDIDIFANSYRSSWLNLLLIGNSVHLLGYMVFSAWLASLLEKGGVRKF